MNVPDTKEEVRRQLALLEVHPNRALGQHFLVDARTVQRLAALLDEIHPPPLRTVWEVGAGLGAVSKLLAERCDSLTLFEIDKRLATFLAGAFSSTPGVRLVVDDVVGWLRRHGAVVTVPDVMVASLPYSAANRIIATITQLPTVFPVLCLVQREFADRLSACAGEKNYSLISVLTQARFVVRVLATVPAGAFWPRPGVMSQMVGLTPRVGGSAPDDAAMFAQTMRTLFTSRRQTVRNNMRRSDHRTESVARACTIAGLSPSQRAEQMPVEILIDFANALLRQEL